MTVWSEGSSPTQSACERRRLSGVLSHNNFVSCKRAHRVCPLNKCGNVPPQNVDKVTRCGFVNRDASLSFRRTVCVVTGTYRNTLYHALLSAGGCPPRTTFQTLSSVSCPSSTLSTSSGGSSAVSFSSAFVSPKVLRCDEEFGVQPTRESTMWATMRNISLRRLRSFLSTRNVLLHPCIALFLV